MTIDAFKSIHQAEAEADAIIRQARTDAARIRDGGQAEAEETVRRALESAKQSAEDYRSRQMRLADEKLSDLRKLHEARLADVRQVAEARKTAAVDLVIERIVGSSGNR